MLLSAALDIHVLALLSCGVLIIIVCIIDDKNLLRLCKYENKLVAPACLADVSSTIIIHTIIIKTPHRPAEYISNDADHSTVVLQRDGRTRTE